MIGTNRSDWILPETRWVAVLVIPFLVVAFIILYFFPFETESLFAWKLQPSMSAMMLGAAYAGGIYFFTRLLWAKQWHHIKVGLPPVTTFASLLGLATILHWDRFNHNHIAFVAWAGLYFTTPFIVLTVWRRNRAQDTGRPDTQDVAIPRGARIVIGGMGAITLLVGLALFLAPPVMISVWPWTLTPLTARVMGAMFALPGAVGLGIALDARWHAAKIILQSQGFSILLILLAAVRVWSEFDWTRPGGWIFVAGLGAMLASIAALYAVLQARSRSQMSLQQQVPANSR
jgi:hypothetical protein